MVVLLGIEIGWSSLFDVAHLLDVRQAPQRTLFFDDGGIRADLDASLEHRTG